MSTSPTLSSSINDLSKSRSWLITGGILSVFVGFLAMSFPLLFSIVIAQLLAAFILGSGIISVALAIFGKHSSHRVLEAFLGLIRIVAGIVLLNCLGSSIAVITLIMAVFLFVEGIFLVAASIKMRAHKGWIWTLVNGVASIVLAVMIQSRWPSDSDWVLGLFFGINMIFSGSSLLALGFAAPKPAAA